MQSKAFSVNPFIYKTMKGLLASSHEIGKFRTFERDSWDDLHKPLINPEHLFPENRWMEDGKTERKEYRQAKKALKQWHENREIADRERVSPFRVMQMAARFLHVPKFYIPTYFDSRLRMYYMCDVLNPQGSDYQKALLLFAEGNPVTPDNIEAIQRDLLITMANAAAVETPAGKTDKLSLQGRIDWALKRVQGVVNKDTGEVVESLEDEARDPVSKPEVLDRM